MNDANDFRGEFVIHKMQPGERVLEFDCGDADLNDFILNDAPDYRKALLAVTYVLTTKENPNRIVAFCSLANDKVSISDFANSTAFNRFRKKQKFPQKKRMKSYPAVKVCRLGVDLSIRGRAAGTKMLNFIKTYFTIENKTGCRFVTVDAYLNAIPFYEKNGFTALNEDEAGTHTKTLFFDLENIL